MSDLISRQAAIEHLKKRLYETEFNSTAEYPYYQEIADNRLDVWMSEVPSVEPDLSEYSDKLWKAAYERGRAEALAERKTGKWICKMTRDSIGCNVKLYMCSECSGWSGDFTYRFCPHCGAYMGGGQDD